MNKPEGKKKVSKRDKLTEIQEFFCLKYVALGGISGKGAEAARLAGSKAKNPEVVASKWLKLTKVKNRIAGLMEKVEKRAIRTAEDWEREVDLVGFYRDHKSFYKEDGTFKDIKDLTEEQLAMVDEVEHTTVGGSGDKPLVKITKLKIHNKLKALDMKGKKLGIYKELKEVVTETYAERIKRLRGDSKP